MMQKICPICDGKLKGNYCPFCRRMVRHPLTWDIGYYLNERRPQEGEYSGAAVQRTGQEPDLEPQKFQGVDLESKAEKRKKALKKSPGDKKAKAFYGKTAEKNNGGKKRQRKGNSGGRAAKWLPGMIVCLAFLSITARELYSNFAYKEEAVETWETELASERITGETELEQDILTWEAELDQEIFAGEGACTGKNHFPVDIETVEPAIWSVMEASTQEEILSGEETYIEEPEEGSDNPWTYYSRILWWEFQGNNEEEYEFITVDCDSVSGELHSLSGWFYDAETAADIFGHLAEILEEEMDLPREEQYADTVSELILENAENEDGYLEYFPGYIFWIMGTEDGISISLDAP